MALLPVLPFLSSHRQFFPAKTHGRLYDQWTIPDLADFSALTLPSTSPASLSTTAESSKLASLDLVEKYRRIIGEMDEEILKQLEQEPTLGKLAPMTSCDSMREEYGRD